MIWDATATERFNTEAVGADELKKELRVSRTGGEFV